MKALGRGSIASYLEIALNVVQVILWVALGLMIGSAALFGVVWALVGAGIVDPAGLGGEPGRDLVALFGLDGSVGGRHLIPTFVAAIIAIGGGIIIVRRLKKLFESFRSAEPFRKENATHLRVIWVTMLGIELSRYGIQALAGIFLAATGDLDEISVNINLTTWAAILVLIVLAEVFREGARLREEQELTI